MSSQAPQVSVVMPVFNAEPYLAEAIESVLTQTHQSLELIIVDDGSTDRTPEIIRSFQGERIHSVRQENAGQASARNRGVGMARGEWIAWQDADDVSLPMRIETLVREAQGSGADYAHSDMALIDEAGRVTAYWQSQQISPHHALPYLLRIGTPFNNASMLVRAAVLKGIRFQALQVGEDTLAVAEFVTRHRGVHVPFPLYLYRRHGSSVSTGASIAVMAEWMISFLERWDAMDLVPEAASVAGSADEQRAVAEALIGLALMRRAAVELAQTWLKAAADRRPGGEARHLTLAALNLAIGRPEDALELLAGVPEGSAVGHNLKGECRVALGRFDEAVVHFRRALTILPGYHEPLANLRAAAVAANITLTDSRVLMYKGIPPR